MSLALTEEQELLLQTAEEFVGEQSPVSRFRELRDSQDKDGFSRALWKEMAELGWTGILYPEEHGGSDMGYAEFGLVLESLGKRLAPEPFLSTVLLAGNAVLLGGNDVQKKDVLTAISEGDKVLALALQEGARYAPYAVATEAKSGGSGYTLSGEKTFVLDGHVADQLVVVARTSGTSGDRNGLTLFLVDGDASGVTRTRTIMVDGRNAAQITFSNVQVDGANVIGQVDQGADVLDAVLDRATIGLCAEMLGGLSEAFDRTVEYLKTREQFGTKIGTFQALKHRAAEMFAEIELARSVTMEALRAVDRGEAELAKFASAAKARCSDVYSHVACEAVQMFGGIGMTDEEDIGLYLKRARTAEHTLGDAAYHRNRFAQLVGF